MKNSAGCLLWKKEDNEIKYFLVKPTGSRAGYGIPKGEIDENESLEEAAVRETKEETGLNFGNPIELTFTIYQNGKIVYCFLAPYISGTFKCNSFFERGNQKFPEVTGGKFFTYDEAIKIAMLAQKKFLDTAKKFLE